MDRNEQGRLRLRIHWTLNLIDLAIRNAKLEAEALGISMDNLVLDDGRPVMTDLLQARVQAYESLALLNEIEKRSNPDDEAA